MYFTGVFRTTMAVVLHVPTLHLYGVLLPIVNTISKQCDFSVNACCNQQAVCT